MKTYALAGLTCILLFIITSSFGSKGQPSPNAYHVSLLDTTPYNMMKKHQNKLMKDTASGSGMYQSQNSGDSNTSRTSTGDYNNSSKSGDSTRSVPPRF